MPIALAGLGGLWSERAGVVNIGLEGMMILGTLGAGYFGFHYGVWAGRARRPLASALLGGLLHALATVVFGVDHIVSGVADQHHRAGRRRLPRRDLVQRARGWRPDAVTATARAAEIDLLFIADPMNTPRGEALVPDQRPRGGRGDAHQEPRPSSLIGLVLIFGTTWVLWRTRFGLRLRSCGESPSAAETLGVNVYRYKFIAVLISGALAGLGGAFLAMVSSSGFQVGQTGGRGYIGLAAMIFGNWRPVGLLFGSLLFGYTQALPLRERHRHPARAAAARRRDPDRPGGLPAAARFSPGERRVVSPSPARSWCGTS